MSTVVNIYLCNCIVHSSVLTVHGIGVPGFVYGAVVKGMLISKPCGNLGRDDLCGDIYISVCMS